MRQLEPGDLPTLEELNAALENTPCPRCGAVGSAVVREELRIVQAPFSLAGLSRKRQARRELILTCYACGVRGRLSPA